MPDNSAKPTRKARVSLKDLAREVGVHVSTISRALDPHRHAPVSQPTS